MSKVPKAFSRGEEEFMLQCRIYGFTPEREFRFVEGRKYAFDFAFPEASPPVAIEIEGGTKFGKSRHSYGLGFEADARKYNLATSLGWRVYRFSSAMVQRGEAIDMLRSVIFEEDL
jgi:hypothetical protein